LRNQGMEKRYANEVVGFNARMTDVGAAIGRVQLSRLAAWTERRRDNARVLDEALEGLPGVVTPSVAEGAMHVYHQYTVRITGAPGRDEVQRRLQTEGVGTGVYYPVPVHRLPSFDLELDLPETARAAEEVLSLPVYPALEPSELERVTAAVALAVRS
jgi:perosamine synthetase